MKSTVTLESVQKAASVIKDVAYTSPLARNDRQSELWEANVCFKREDLQQVRSYKIRGAYNKISSLSADELEKGVVCASAGNHAQGVALSCTRLKVHGVVFMPLPTPQQKIEQVKMFGGSFIEVRLVGDTYDDANNAAQVYCSENEMTFIHPFDDIKVIEGQGTIALELLEQMDGKIDYLFLPVGGGGLASGVGSIVKKLSPETRIIGVEPLGAASMTAALDAGTNVCLGEIDKFVDGASVQQVGKLNFEICREVLSEIATVNEGKVCQTILDLHNKDAIVVEPAGSLSVAVLEQYRDQIKGKNVVCLISGSNNDITRTEEIRERALLYAGLKHYFVVRFPQRAGALKFFISEVLGPKDDITHFEYSKKHNRNAGPAVIGIELENMNDLQPLIERMKQHKFYSDYLNDKPDLFQFLV